MKRINLFLLALIFSTLTACGGGDEGYGSGGTTPAGGDDPIPQGEGTTPPEEITIGSVVITHPNEAIVDNKDGTYSFMYTVLVRDQDGSPATNGVRVDLQVVDSVIARGAMTDLNTDIASGTNLTVPGVTDTENTSVDLTIASVTRPGLAGGSIRQIQAGDLVIMTGSLEQVLMSTGLENGQVDSRDVVRTVASVPTISDQLTVNSIYNANYPDYGVNFGLGGTNYYIAASMLGAGITGEDTGGVPTQSHTVTTDSLGTAKVWITYPADNEHIHFGCSMVPDDTRISPLGSARPMLIATAGGISNVRDFCFSSIAPYNISASPNAVVVSGLVDVCVRDGGNGGGVRVPFRQLSFGQTGDALINVFPNPAYTGEDGCVTILVTATGGTGTAGTLVIEDGGGSTSVSVTVP